MDESMKEVELLRKDEVTVFGRAMNEVKEFKKAMQIVIVKFYSPYLKPQDW